MIRIRKSPTADSRSCDHTNVTKPLLRLSTDEHIRNVMDATKFFANMLITAGYKHDNHKLETMDAFHTAFTGGFKDETWWNEHKKERHHLPENLEDINLIDILEHISDCVTAGMARTGEVRPLIIDDKLLQKAFQNTVKLLIDNIKVEK